jgi:alginate biosynthesis protein AlgX
MGRQLSRRLKGALTLPMLLSLLLMLAAGAAHSADDGGGAAPVYKVALCCQLCPQAAEPGAYQGSSYLEEFSVLQQGRDGWLFRTGVDLATHFDITDESLLELRRLASALRARGSELVVVLQPPRGLVDVDKLSDQQRAAYDFNTARQNYAAALQRIRSAGVTVPALDTLIDEHKNYEYFFRRDHHWTPAGAEATAKVVAATVQKLPAFKDVPRKSFTTRPAMLIGKPGTLQKVAEQICGGAYSMQYVTGYTTEPSGGGDAAASLLGDDAKAGDASGGGLLDTSSGGDAGGLLGDGGDEVPDIVLVGTSNSDSKGGYNFAGYIEQYVGADVLDVAITGGSFDGSLLHYLPSELYQKHPPKIIVWEMPWQDWPGSGKSPYKSVRQAIPLVHDGCEGRPSALTRTIDVKPGSNEMLFNGGGAVKPLVGSRYWLDLQFDDPGVKDLHAVIWYFSGQKESLKLHFKQYVDNRGRFVSEFRNNRPDYAKGTVMGVTLEVDQPPAKPLKVTAKICEVEGAAQRTATLEDDAHARN